MALDTYDNLKSAIADTLNRDDLSSQIEDFIRLAESRHRREIRIREMIERAQATLDDVTPSRFLSLPDRFVQMKTLRLLTSPEVVLQEVNLHEMNRQRRMNQICEGETGRPKFFTIHEEIEFDRVPDQGYTAEMIYYAAFVPLSDTNPTNGLLQRAPDAYLYGALLAAAPWIDFDERAPLWADLYSTTRDRLREDEMRAMYGTPLFARVDGPTP